MIIILGGFLPNVLGEKITSNTNQNNTLRDINKGMQIPGSTEKNIIISPPRFYRAAKELKEFHDNYGIPTKVINTTWISEYYQTAPSPTYAGYSNRIITRLFVKNYDFNLAKKIINFLRDDLSHPELEYVTLFGNGAFVPPSYYIHSRGRMLRRIFLLLSLPDIYNNIVATDFFYTSPDYDIIPDFKVGRLPVSNENEAFALVEKIKDWRENENFDWFKNIYVGGDQPNLPEEMSLKGCYAGEMIGVDAINQNYFSSMDITKLFWTENKFNKKDILEALELGNAGFMYMMAHGFVDRWGTYMETDPFIYADNILDLPENKNIPVIVSVACMSGAYDTNLICTLNLDKGTKSLGEAFLLSKGAGIAYVGTTRATLGSPLLYLDEGEVVITKERGIAGMLTYFFEAYYNGEYILGDMTKKAIERYINENNFPLRPERENDFIVLASFVLLGDPALDIPSFNYLNTLIDPCKQPDFTVINPEGFTEEEYPRPWYYIKNEIEILIETDSPYINIKRIDINSDTVVEKRSFYPTGESFVYTFTSYEPTEYLIRAETIDWKESWLYLTTKEVDGYQ